MKRTTFIRSLFLGLALTCMATVGWSQASPAATATGNINGANISIKYSSPSVRERAGKIWGTLVPYGKVWRAGANQATVLETDKDITVEGKALPAGKYSIYAIPGESEWTIIINSQTGPWGITRQQETTADPAKDVLRVTVKPAKSATMNERLVYTINANGFVLSWENLDVPVSIK